MMYKELQVAHGLSSADMVRIGEVFSAVQQIQPTKLKDLMQTQGHIIKDLKRDLERWQDLNNKLLEKLV